MLERRSRKMGMQKMNSHHLIGMERSRSVAGRTAIVIVGAIHRKWRRVVVFETVER
jgi:hypothetical protein